MLSIHQNLVAEVEIANASIVSKTIHQDDNLKAVVFAFDSGQELSEHTASVPAILQFLDGQAEVTLGDEHMTSEAGTFVHMPAKLPHSIKAIEPTKMLLLMLKRPN